jgi:hypothetical protein
MRNGEGVGEEVLYGCWFRGLADGWSDQLFRDNGDFRPSGGFFRGKTGDNAHELNQAIECAAR